MLTQLSDAVNAGDAGQRVAKPGNGADVFSQLSGIERFLKSLAE